MQKLNDIAAWLCMGLLIGYFFTGVDELVWAAAVSLAVSFWARNKALG